MCGVIGVSLRDATESDITLVRNIFLQSMIRGKHATGVTYRKEGKLHTIKKPISADQFMEEHSVEDWVDRNDLHLIGHIRYSTSDLRYNQPFTNGRTSIAHNGVISQDPDIWEYETETKNDSELILRCLEAGDDPLDKYKHRSMAVVGLSITTLFAYRNPERPLWRSERTNGAVFASTRNILERSGLGDLHRCESMVKYSYEPCGLTIDNSRVEDDMVDLQP